MRNFVRTLCCLVCLGACGGPLSPTGDDPRPELARVESVATEMALNLKNVFSRMRKMTTVSVTPQPGLAERLAGWGLPRIEFDNLEFDSADARYVWSRRVLRERVLALTGHCKNDRDRLAVVLHWIHLHCHQSAGQGMVEEFGLMPETVLWRGYGHPNRQAYALHALLRQLDIDCALVARREDTLPTIVAVRIGGDWLFADSATGQLVADPGGDFYFTFDPRGITRRIRSISSALVTAWPARYGMDFLAEEKQLRQWLPAGRTLKVFNPPVKWIRQWRDPDQRSTILVMTQGLSGGSTKGRANLISGQVARAQLEFTSVERQDALTRFYMAQCAYELKNDAEARRDFNWCLKQKTLERLHKVIELYLERLGPA